MAGSCTGTVFKVMTWGESHGNALGAVIDGCPSKIALSEDDINAELARRAPGKSAYSTKRREADSARLLSGVFNGMTTGTPISVIVENTDSRSHDYSEIADVFRPSHADYTFLQKYGIRDYRGGGRSSGRETVGRVIAGAIAKKVLSELGVTVNAYAVEIGGVCAEKNADGVYDLTYASQNPLCMPDKIAYEKAAAVLDSVMKNGDSVGGVIECVIEGVPVGVGEPVFGKLDAEISRAVMSIGAVKGIEFGAGFSSARMKGSENNDSFIMRSGQLCKTTNNAGGILGGISDGSAITFRAAIKPTPSISKTQQTVNKNGENVEIAISGRHDPVIAPRACVVVEAMAAVTILDLLLINNAYSVL